MCGVSEVFRETPQSLLMVDEVVNFKSPQRKAKEVRGRILLFIFEEISPELMN